MVEGTGSQSFSIRLGGEQAATPLNQHAGRFSTSPGNTHQRMVIEGLGNDLQEVMAIRYADTPPLLAQVRCFP